MHMHLCFNSLYLFVNFISLFEVYIIKNASSSESEGVYYVKSDTKKINDR